MFLDVVDFKLFFIKESKQTVFRELNKFDVRFDLKIFYKLRLLFALFNVVFVEI